jgi:pyruvate/2-oxoglutarate dehydrogenase complex dihydrolipoamide acyltransferase (E2) component
VIEVTLLDDAWEGVEPGTEALLDRWLVREGDRVEVGQVVARVVLVKANLDITSPAKGVIERILVPAEQTFAKGRPLATLREA